MCIRVKFVECVYEAHTKHIKEELILQIKSLVKISCLL